MRQWKHVAIPPLMQKLPKDPRGYPIPVIILQDDHGKFHFQINDERKVEICIEMKLCSICGNELHDDMWFAGGALSALHPHGVFIDTPVHHECGQYAMQVCPYLAAAAYTKHIDVSKIKSEDFGNTLVFVDPTVMPDKPAFFVLGQTVGYKVKRSNGGRYLTPFRPYLKIEYWKDGIQLDKAVAMLMYEDYKRSKQLV